MLAEALVIDGGLPGVNNVGRQLGRKGAFKGMPLEAVPKHLLKNALVVTGKENMRSPGMQQQGLGLRKSPQHIGYFGFRVGSWVARPELVFVDQRMTIVSIEHPDSSASFMAIDASREKHRHIVRWLSRRYHFKIPWARYVYFPCEDHP